VQPGEVSVTPSSVQSSVDQKVKIKAMLVRKCTQEYLTNQMKIKKAKNLISLRKENCLELASESVNGINSTKWWRQIVPRVQSNHSKRAAQLENVRKIIKWKQN